ncbi:hypothetical protein [Modestobacter excelsi]|uniref:hypothetical protein n=1 Tax=Modestobacter excelsi TaxID=2213161 RepID=UPI00110CEF56|nr:hypothetical protein [Modestobacter excelsi]
MSDISLIAGSVATLLFVTGHLPMLLKAFRTRDLASYSLASLVITNVGNLGYSAYVLGLPPGPIWALHNFYLLSTLLMLRLRLRHRPRAACGMSVEDPRRPITRKA